MGEKDGCEFPHLEMIYELLCLMCGSVMSVTPTTALRRLER